jgi:hypothetical protein
MSKSALNLLKSDLFSLLFLRPGIYYLVDRRLRVTLHVTFRKLIPGLINLLLPTLILLSGVDTTCFSSCRDKDSSIIFTTGRLPNVNPL